MNNREAGTSMREMPVQGSSMGRTWSQAHSMLVLPLNGNPRWSDVIVYETPAGLVAHRIVRSFKRGDQRYWVTKGDGYWMPDRVVVTREQMVGIVTALRSAKGIDDVGRGWAALVGYVQALVGCVGSWWWTPMASADARK